MDEDLLAQYHAKDSLAFVEQLPMWPDRVACVKKLHEVGKQLYWKEKALPGCVALLRAAAQAGLTAEDTDPARRYDLRSSAKAACYDIASFTWTGWDEPGITITASDLAIGHDAAKANLRLAIELEKGDLPISRAHWILAGHLLAIKDYPAAIEQFEISAEHARRAEAPGEVLAASGFATLTHCLRDPNDAAPTQQLEKIKTDLAEIKDGQFFVSQIETAARVFAG
jgi:hypothetical protein